MTENSESLPDAPEADSLAPSSNGGYRQTATTGDTGGGALHSEMAGLVLLINTVLGGLGTLYVTTRSGSITFVSALQVLLITVVVFAAKHRGGRDSRPGRKDERSGR